MKRLIFLLAAVATAVLFVPGGSVSAQEGVTVTNGVIVGVDTGGGEELVRFALSDQGGNVTEYTVQPSTQYGLENQAGERWVSTQGEEPAEAARQLRDHQQRFAAVTVTSQNGVALSVVERESGRLETNLAFLFAVFAVTWAGFFAYIFYMSRKQRELQREVARLRASMDEVSEE
jgi:CcmD family protein